MFHPTNMFETHHHLLDHMSQPHKTPEENDQHQLDMLRDEEFESKSGGTDILEPPSGDDDKDPNQRPKKKRYHRHTQHQIQEMESYVFSKPSHPT